MKKAILLLFAVIMLPALSRSQDTTGTQILQPVKRDSGITAEKPIPVTKIDLIEVKNADLKDVIRGIAAKYNLNVLIDDAVQQRVTLRLADIPVPEALAFLARENGLNFDRPGLPVRGVIPADFPACRRRRESRRVGPDRARALPWCVNIVGVLPPHKWRE
jgi:hypothetical protein